MRKFRIFTWVILAVNVLFLVWIITGISGNASDPACTANATACQVGTGIGALLIVFLWVAADVILGILWLVTKPKTRDCPACGRGIKRGVMVCKGCGFDFAQAAARSDVRGPQ
jgi:hypothetical protein